MMKKRIKKILNLIQLIAVRQLWKLTSNLYHLVTQPFLTLKNLVVKDKDKSQIFLITVMAVMPIISYIGARIIWDKYKYGMVSRSVGDIFLIVLIIEALIWSYLGFWLWKIFKKNRRSL